jgi:hypothetical protein
VWGGSDATIIPQGAINWTFFEGALLSVVISTVEEQVVVGTAVVVAPGLAVTATHLFDKQLSEILQGTATLTCMGPTSAGMELWRVRKLSSCKGDDLAYMSIELASSILPGWRFRSIAVTTRAPRPGESVSLVGFHFPRMTREGSNTIRAYGNLYAAAGEVACVHHPIRDRFLMPYPVIEVDCGSLGGMSGGAVLDRQGYLLGVTSRGLETEDGKGPSNCAWIIGGLNRQIEIPWPPGLYQQPIHILQIDQRAMRIEGRDRIRAINEHTTQYQVWSDR